MEDAAISELDIGNGNSIFGVFDGHGGTQFCKKVLKYRSMSRRYLYLNSRTQNRTNSKNINKHCFRLSRRSMR